MNLIPTLRYPLPPRNQCPKVANLGIHVLENLGNHMNIMNSKNILGKLKNIKNSLGVLNNIMMNNPRKRAKRGFSLAKSPHPKDSE